MKIFNQVKSLDPIFVLNILILIFLGLISVFSTTYVKSKGISDLFWSQLLFYFVGFLVMLVTTKIDYKKYVAKDFLIFITLITLALLVWVILKAPVIYGVKSWIRSSIRRN